MGGHTNDKQRENFVRRPNRDIRLQPSKDGRYFLVVLHTIPDSGVTVVASDKDGRVESSEEHSKALITSPRIPSQTSPPPKS